MKDNEKMGMVRHITEAYADGRADCIHATIPLDVFSEDALAILRYWCIEEFDYASIDWENHEIFLHYETEHFQK